MTLEQALVPPANLNQMTPVEPTSTAQTPTPIAEAPGRNQFLSSPLPGSSATPDALRQFYGGAKVPLFRINPLPRS